MLYLAIHMANFIVSAKKLQFILIETACVTGS